MSVKETAKIDELRWVRAFSAEIIPSYLVEQIRDRDYSVEDFYKYQAINCTDSGKDGITLNPFHHLYVLANKEHMVKGFLWFVIDPLSKDMVVNIYSVDKAYWNGGGAVKKAVDHFKEVKNKLHLDKVFWITNYPKHSERHGFKRCKSVIMEYTGEEEDGREGHIDGGHIQAEELGHVEPTTEAALQHSA